jgi:alkylation response protein AidB-like acyl-CoA dehydrogenase
MTLSPEKAEPRSTERTGPALVEKAGVPSVEEFAAEAEEFLIAHAERREAGRREFVWGEGTDTVELFKTTSPAEIQAARDWRRTLFDAGLGWITGPLAYGGRELSLAHQRRFDALENRFQVPARALFSISLGCVAPTITDFGTHTLKEQWLAAMYRGDVLGCQLFSEPGAGSDLAGVSTRATLDGNTWIVNGQKVWTSRARFSDLGLLLTRTAPGPRNGNLTMFLVPMDAPGIEIRPLREMTGGEEFNEVFFDDVRIPDTQRLGEVGDGWRVAKGTLAHERSATGGSGAGGGGILRIDRMIALIKEFGKQDDPEVRRLFGELYIGLITARVSRERTEGKLRSGQLPGPEASAGKLELTRNLARISSLAQEVLSDRLVADTGEWGTFAWSELVLGVPGLRIAGGTDEVQRNIVAERVLGLPR